MNYLGLQFAYFRKMLHGTYSEKYSNYTDALKILKLGTLNERRDKLILKYGKQCTN